MGRAELRLSDSLQEDVIHVQGEELLPAFLIKLSRGLKEKEGESVLLD